MIYLYVRRLLAPSLTSCQCQIFPYRVLVLWITPDCECAGVYVWERFPSVWQLSPRHLIACFCSRMLCYSSLHGFSPSLSDIRSLLCSTFTGPAFILLLPFFYSCSVSHFSSGFWSGTHICSSYFNRTVAFTFFHHSSICYSNRFSSFSSLVLYFYHMLVSHSLSWFFPFIVFPLIVAIVCSFHFSSLCSLFFSVFIVYAFLSFQALYTLLGCFLCFNSLFFSFFSPFSKLDVDECMVPYKVFPLNI